MTPNDPVERAAAMRFRTGEHTFHCEHGAACDAARSAPTYC